MKLKVGVMRREDGFLKEVRNREGSGTCVIGAQKREVTEERKRTKSKWGMRKCSLGRKWTKAKYNDAHAWRCHDTACSSPQ